MMKFHAGLAQGSAGCAYARASGYQRASGDPCASRRDCANCYSGADHHAERASPARSCSAASS